MTTRGRDARPPTIVGASAGTGKTHYLTELVWRACGPRGDVPGDALVAVTFTRPAAAELADRIRERLFSTGGAREVEAARRLAMGYVGTVHEVGLRLVEEHAFEAGLPLDSQVLTDLRPALHEVFERAVPAARAERLAELARRLGPRFDRERQRSRWMDDIFDIVAGARNNRIAPSELPAMAERSLAGLVAMLHPPTSRDLEAEVIRAGEALAIPDGDTTAKTWDTALGAVEKGLDEIRQGIWSGWVRIANAEPGKLSREAFAPLQAIARAHLGHPRLRAELTEYVREAYAAAADVMTHLAEWKEAQRVVDYTDMLDLALRVLDDPRVADDVAARLALVVVDEVQDSGPLQLALFARLHALIGRSTWVGDPKQCIFEWAGADPGLMDALVAEAQSHGGRAEPLGKNYRSRPALVELCSEVFARAFERRGVRPEDVRVAAARGEDPPELAAVPPLGLVAMPNGWVDLARAVARMLANPEVTPVLDRETGVIRLLRASDVAILVRTNDHADEVTNALNALGVATESQRFGLLATREGRLVTSALRALVARGDAHAEAELEALAGWSTRGDDPDAGRRAWLEERLAGADEAERRKAARPFDALLRPLRAELSALSVSAVYERILEVLDVPHWVKGFPDADQATGNLDALRALVRGYEDAARQAGRAATVSGLLRALDEAATSRDPKDAQRAGRGPGAVTVMTYHKSKGLEWPVVVLASLESGDKKTAFEVRPESEATPTLSAPLAGRWIRYWPWPYGVMGSGELRDAVASSPTGVAVTEREQRERLRLLYVGFTRARDHLVLALKQTRRGAFETAWLDELADASGPLVVPPTGPSGRFRCAGREVRTRHWPTSATSTATTAAPEVRTFARLATRRPHPARFVAPSRVAREGAELGAQALGPGTVVELGPPLAVAVRGDDDAHAVGLAAHGFLASDEGPAGASGAEARRARAAAWLAAHATTAVPPEALVLAGDRLRAFVAARWPGATWRPEHPIAVELASGRRMQGTLDLLLELPDGGLVVLDHKSSWARLEDAAREHAPQLAAYALGLAKARPGAAVAAWLHFPLAGRAVELAPFAAPATSTEE